MLTFTAYICRIAEAFRPKVNTNLNWNVMPNSAPKAGVRVPPANQELTYHKDIGFPQDFHRPRPGLTLRYGPHSTDALRDDNTRPPSKVPANFNVIEVTLMQGQVVKWLIRYPYDAKDDLCMIVQPDGFCRTVWINAHNDTHSTLDTKKYTSP